MTTGIPNPGMVSEYMAAVTGHGKMPEAQCYVEFSILPKENRSKSEKAGKPVYEDWEWIKLMPAGGNSVVERWVTDKDKKRFPAQYEAFKSGLEPTIEGTAVEMWPAVTPAEVKMLRGATIRTVEDLAVCSETALSNIGFGARGLQAKAREWLIAAVDTGKSAAKIEHLREEVKSLKLRNKELEKQNTDLRNNFRTSKEITENTWEAEKSPV